MEDIKFSILIPAYKIDFLYVAVNSVITQNYENWELIILNDCSPFDLKSEINKFSDERIVYIENDYNVGAENVVRNWNKCLDNCTGDYAICIGDDDVLGNNCLQVYYEYIKRYPNVNVFHSRSIIINENGTPQYITNSRPEKESVYSLMKHRMIEEQFMGDFCHKISVLRDCGGYFYLPLAWGSDDVTAFLCAADGGIVNVPTPIFYYRKSSVNITSTGNVGKKIESLNLLNKWYDEFLKRIPDTEIEKLERASVLNRLNKYIFQRKAEDISMDLRCNLTHIFSWFIKKKQYSLSTGCILYGFCIALYYKA